MKARKIIFYTVGTLLLAILLIILLTPLLLYKNQRKITQMAVESLNEGFSGQLVVGDSYISPFKNFPYISIDLHHVQFFADKAKSSKPLYEIDDIYLGFDVLAMLEGEYNVKKLKIEGGHLDIVQYTDGSINILQAKGFEQTAADSSSSEESKFHFDLSKMSIKDFDITYYQEKNAQLTESYIDEAEAAFKLSTNHTYITLDTKLLLNIVNNGDSSFFHHKHIDLHATLDYLEEEKILKISPSILQLEEASFGLQGHVDFDDDFFIDIELHGNKPDFNLFIAFAPPEIAPTLKLYENAGRIYFDGKIKGKAGKGHRPFIEANFGCENAYFLKTNINKKIDEFGFKGYFSNGEERTWKAAELRLLDITARPGSGIFTGNLIVKDFTDPQIAVNVHSDLDLRFLGDFFGLEDLQHISGQVILDMHFNELIDMNIPENNLVKLKEGIESELLIKNLNFFIPDYPHAVENMNLHAQMQEGKVTLDSISFKVGQSDIYVDGMLSDLPAIFHHQEKPINIALNAKSKKLVFNELLAFDSALAQSTNEEISQFNIRLAMETSVDHLTNAHPLPKGEFFIEDFYAKLKHYPHTFHDFHADVIINDSSFLLKDFSGQIDQSDFHFDGQLDNYNIWFSDNKKGDTQFEFNLTSNLIKLHDLLSYEGENYLPEDYRDEEVRELKLHGKLDLHYDSTFHAADLQLDTGEALLKIHPLKMRKFAANIHFEDDHLTIKDFSGHMGKSDFNINLTLYTGEDQRLKKRDNTFFIKSNFLDIDQLTNYNAKTDTIAHEDAFNIFEIPFTEMRAHADIKKLNYHHIWLKDFVADLRMQSDHYLYVDTLHMLAADGSVAMKGYFNGSDPGNIYFKSQIDVEDINLDKFLLKFDNFGQDYIVNDNLHGRVNGTINSTLHLHPDLTPILEDGEAHLDMQIVDGSLVDFGPMQAMSGFFKDKNLRMIKFDTLQNKLDLNKGVLHIPNMNINSSLGFIEVSGTQSLDMNMEYFVRVPLSLVTQVGFKALFGGKNKEEVDPEQEDAIVYRNQDKKVRFLNVKIAGNTDDYKVSLGKK